MKRILPLFALIVLAACATSRSAALAIRDVTVIDATGAKPRVATVVIENGRIASIGHTRVPRGARVVDGAGKFLIPGLFDMHTHLSFFGDEALPLLVRYGVLSVRDLGGLLEQLDGWRAEIDRGARIGPRIYRAGPYVDGPREYDETPDGQLRRKTTIMVTTAEEARAAVQSLKERGVDTIKTHNSLSREAFLAVAAECRRLDLPLAVHPPSRTTTLEIVSDAKPATIEHVEMLTESICFSEPEADGKPKSPLAALDELTDERTGELFRRFARNGTTYDPALVAYRTFMQEAVDNLQKDKKWEWAAAGRTKMFKRFVELVGLMHRLGVQVTTGTDFGTRPENVPYPVSLPGTDLHEEMKLLVDGGFTPLEALQSATVVPARTLRVANRTGTIEAGKDADLVLLDRDPLADIANTRAIAGVVARGVWHDRASLEAASAKK